MGTGVQLVVPAQCASYSGGGCLWRLQCLQPRLAVMPVAAGGPFKPESGMQEWWQSQNKESDVMSQTIVPSDDDTIQSLADKASEEEAYIAALHFPQWTYEFVFPWKSWDEVPWPDRMPQWVRDAGVFLEIFAGTAHLTVAMRTSGIVCLPPIEKDPEVSWFKASDAFANQ